MSQHGNGAFIAKSTGFTLQSGKTGKNAKSKNSLFRLYFAFLQSHPVSVGSKILHRRSQMRVCQHFVALALPPSVAVARSYVDRKLVEALGEVRNQLS